eukprot:2417082-Prymnesium_polylepis.1
MTVEQLLPRRTCEELRFRSVCSPTSRGSTILHTVFSLDYRARPCKLQLNQGLVRPSRSKPLQRAARPPNLYLNDRTGHVTCQPSSTPRY